MSVRSFAFLFAITLSGFSVSSSWTGAEEPTVPKSKRLILTLQRADQTDAVIADFGLRIKHRYERYTRARASALRGKALQRFQKYRRSSRVISIEGDQISPELLNKLKSDPRIKRIEPDARIQLVEQTPGRHLTMMGILDFPSTPINTGQNVTLDVHVAVLDSGIGVREQEHEDLNVVQRVGFADAGLDGFDWGSGHGTAMAGIIGAKDNGVGIVGVAPGAKLWSVQVVGPTEAYWSNIFAGLDYIAQHTDQISVVNASFATYDPSPRATIQEKIQTLVDDGVVFVAAVGNHSKDLRGVDQEMGTDDDTLPASLPEVMAVSAYNDLVYESLWFKSGKSSMPHNVVHVFSDGGAIDVTAFGVDIPATDMNGGYRLSTGTSPSTAITSGLVAFYIAERGRAHNAAGVYAIRQAIVNAALPQTDWPTFPSTLDFDGHPEPLARVNPAWYIPPPAPTQVLSISKTELGYEIRFRADTRCWYRIEYTEDLSSNVWKPLTTFLGSESDTSLVPPMGLVIDPALDRPARFYRIANGWM